MMKGPRTVGSQTLGCPLGVPVCLKAQKCGERIEAVTGSLRRGRGWGYFFPAEGWVGARVVLVTMRERGKTRSFVAALLRMTRCWLAVVLAGSLDDCWSWFPGVAVEDAAAVRAYVDAAEELGIAGDLEYQSPLMAVVVDAGPGAAFVDGAEDAGLVADGADEVHGGIGVAGSWFAEAEGVDLLDVFAAQIGAIGVGFGGDA